MNLVADESVDQPIVSRLRADGHLVKAVSELSPGITDNEVLSRATDQGAVLLTADIVSRVIRGHAAEFSGAFSVIEHGQVRIRRPIA